MSSPTDRPSLGELEGQAEFPTRHIGTDGAERRALLAELGVGSLDQLIDEAVPPAIRNDEPLALPGPTSERQVTAQLRALAARNKPFTSLIGMGYYGTVVPPVIARNVLENPAWYTAYTPYQPEISQGRLEALLNFQTLVCDLSGMDLANASLLDEGTRRGRGHVDGPPDLLERLRCLPRRPRYPSPDGGRPPDPGRTGGHPRRRGRS